MMEHWSDLSDLNRSPRYNACLLVRDCQRSCNKLAPRLAEDERWPDYQEQEQGQYFPGYALVSANEVVLAHCCTGTQRGLTISIVPRMDRQVTCWRIREQEGSELFHGAGSAVGRMTIVSQAETRHDRQIHGCTSLPMLVV